MSEGRIQPFLITEDKPAPRLEEAPLPPVPAEAPEGRSALGLIGAGFALFGCGAAGLGLVNFVAAEFAYGPALGWASVALVAGSAGLIGTGIARELGGLGRLRRVEAFRAALDGHDPTTRLKAARAWVRGLPEAAALDETLRGINDPDAILAVLRAGPVAERRAQAEALGRASALQAVAGLAAMPSPALAGLFVAWRGLRLIRQVAALHGMRPGLAGTLALVRRTALAAGSVAATEMLANSAAHAALSNPLLAHLAGDMAGAGLAARRLMVLARAADAACCPVPPEPG